jgi:hypothetical protein
MGRTARFSSIDPNDPRPVHRRNVFRPDMGAEAIEMARQGMFPEEWAGRWGVTLPAIYAWATAHPDFEADIHEAWWVLRGYWTGKAREAAEGRLPGGASPQVLMHILMRRFPDTWSKGGAKITHEHFALRNVDPTDVDTRDLTDEQITQRIEELRARRQEAPVPALPAPDGESDGKS